ncbi:MAG: gephyrin-like molybdotransferase Glp [Gemmatimonadota bacterium]
MTHLEPHSVSDACTALLAAVQVQPSLRVPLADAVGHVLAEEIFAPIPLPPWTNAAMDGYAVHAADVRGASATSPVSLRVVAVVAAGDAPSRALQRGEAVRVYTGAAVPEGADSVVRQEDSDRGIDDVVIHHDRDAGANVRPLGGDLARGAVALVSGTVLGPHQLALLAALAVAHPVVRRKPRVGLLTGGDEVVSLDHREQILDGTRLSDVNGPALTALINEAGGVAVPLGLVPDDPDALDAAVSAARDIDLLITAGGVSVGDRDHVREVMRRQRVTAVIDRVRIRPGGPTAFGMLPDGRGWLALPGNPVSAMVTFELFARPVIRRMAGHPEPRRRAIRVRLERAVTRDARLELYPRVTLAWPADGGLPLARLTGPQGSGILTSIARSDGLLIVAPGSGALQQEGWVLPHGP